MVSYSRMNIKELGPGVRKLDRSISRLAVSVHSRKETATRLYRLNSFLGTNCRYYKGSQVCLVYNLTATGFGWEEMMEFHGAPYIDIDSRVSNTDTCVSFGGVGLPKNKAFHALSKYGPPEVSLQVGRLGFKTHHAASYVNAQTQPLFQVSSYFGLAWGLRSPYFGNLRSLILSNAATDQSIFGFTNKGLVIVDA